MSARRLTVARRLWLATWEGLRRCGGGRREAACVWVGTREGSEEQAREVIFLDDLPGTIGRRLQHRTSRAAVATVLERAREMGFVIVADIHTHPGAWVDLSEVDQEHPIEYRLGLLALVLPNFATSTPDVSTVGVHEYVGDGQWSTFENEAVEHRLRIVDDKEFP